MSLSDMRYAELFSGVRVYIGFRTYRRVVRRHLSLIRPLTSMAEDYSETSVDIRHTVRQIQPSAPKVLSIYSIWENASKHLTGTRL